MGNGLGGLFFYHGDSMFVCSKAFVESCFVGTWVIAVSKQVATMASKSPIPGLLFPFQMAIHFRSKFWRMDGWIFKKNKVRPGTSLMNTS